MKFTHLSEDGAAYTVDVTAKSPTMRRASAVCRMDCSSKVMRALRDGTISKSDALAVARMAGIPTAKRVPELLPLAHAIGVHGCAVDLNLEDDHVATHATVHTADRTGAEMEALTSVTVMVPAIVGMVKGVDRSAHIRETKIAARSDGCSGDWVRPEDPQA